jgi:hypothetical protein
MALIALGNVIVVAVLIMQYVQPQTYTMFVTLLTVGGIVAYSGFWALDPKRTRDATQNLADVATKTGDVIVKVRGRRKTDPVVRVDTEPGHVPGQSPTTTVTVESPTADPATPMTMATVVPQQRATPQRATPPYQLAGAQLVRPRVDDDQPGARVPGEGD